MHLCQLNTVLEGTYLRDIPSWISIIVMLVFLWAGYLIGAIASQMRTLAFLLRSFIVVLLCTLYACISFLLFRVGYVIPVVFPYGACIIAYTMAIFGNYVTEGRQRRFLKAAFKQYLSPAVIDSLIDNPDNLNLGGEEREITAYFSDVQGFTSISESLSPSELTDLLNTYLSAMTDIILDYGGTIDKYEGDAIIAFWGAPVAQKDHAKRAVEAALACQKKLKELEPTLKKSSGKPFVQRIGLNTGRAVVGNMGSRSRFDYTMMGDTVNLASRLEGINKQFGTYTMCSEATMKSAMENGCKKAFAHTGRIAVVGRQNGVEVYVPMEISDFASCSKERDIFEKGYELFVKGAFREAKDIFETGSETSAVCAKYVEKCTALIKNPPENWDGTIRATEK